MCGARPETCRRCARLRASGGLAKLAAAAERAVDSVALYAMLDRGTVRHVYDGLPVLDAHKPPLDEAAGKIGPVGRSPVGARGPDWQRGVAAVHASSTASHAAAPVGATSEKIYSADEYYHGTLDWYSFDIDPNGALGAAGRLPDPQTTITRAMIPVPLTYAGMPHQRWSEMEDGRHNFGEIRRTPLIWPNCCSSSSGSCSRTTGLWSRSRLPMGTIAEVRGLAVTTVFSGTLLDRGRGPRGR